MKKILSLCLVTLLLMPSAWAKPKINKGHAAVSSAAAAVNNTVLGIDRIDEPEVAELLRNKRVGVFTNQSGVNKKLESSVDVLKDRFNVTAIFVPEHGLWGAVAAGEKFKNNVYENITVFSIYGDSRRPSKEMLDAVDVIAVDIQDVGVRHYTYTSSLAYIMEECAKYGKEVVVFDRPNPLGGAVEGPVLKPRFSSFIGLYELPLRHGLTLGEFAKFINTEKKINCQLKVVPMENWRRDMYWKDTGLAWVQTSPLIPTAETAILYNVTGVCGNTPISVGVGTAKPFYYVAAPFADAKVVKEKLEALQIKGVAFRKAAFTSKSGRYKDELAQGVEIFILDPKEVNLSELEYSIMYIFQELYPEHMGKLPQRYGGLGETVDIALGEDSIKKHENPQEAFARWKNECKNFSAQAAPYLLYK